ncbi:MAG: 1-(5-phosphoribosyl)-5-[(5-phosphoribosylamino)methylideneamino] imidazole-4-carboxamide isomerase [Acidimicrobiales bacterium]
MDLYAAIDLLGGHCVRLAGGDFARETDYGTDPLARAKAFESHGAAWLHVVDLDAARTGEAVNRHIVAAIASSVKVPVQAGGGARSLADVEALLGSGVARVVLGTAAVAQPGLLASLAQRWPGRVAAGVDHKQGQVRVKGWQQGAGRLVVDVVKEMASAGAACIVVTEIGRDGMMTGPDIAGYKELLEICPVPLVASGGVGSLEDLRKLSRLEVGGRRLSGVIVGRAIYEGRFGVPEAVAACRGAQAEPGLGHARVGTDRGNAPQESEGAS